MYAHSFIAFDPCMCVHVNRQPNPFAMSSILDVTIHIACIGMLYMSVNPSQHLSCTSFVYAHLHRSQITYGRVPSTFQQMHGYMSIINTASSTTSKCAYMSALASTKVIIMCVHRQQPVCISTFTPVLRACLHVRTFLHCFRSLHAHTACVHQHNALSTITWICAYITQVNILCVLRLVYTHQQQSDLTYMPTLPSTPACVHVNHQPKPSTITWVAFYMEMHKHVSIGFKVNILCVHKQALCVCTFTTKYVLSCLDLHKCINGHVRTCQHLCLRPFN